jgi:hypothetical protein
MLVKELRSLGANAEFAHSSDERLFEVKKSAEALFIAYVVGIASSASWELMTVLLRRRKNRLSVTFLELEGNKQRGLAWKVEGDPDSVIRAIDTLRTEPPSTKSIEDGLA